MFTNKVDVFDLFVDEYQDLQKIPYKFVKKNGEEIRGFLDEDGRTARIFSYEEENMEVFVGGSEWEIFSAEGSYLLEDDEVYDHESEWESFLEEDSYLLEENFEDIEANEL